MLGAQLYLLLFKLVLRTETTTSGASTATQMCHAVHTNHSVSVLLERTVPALQCPSFILPPAFQVDYLCQC